MDVQEVKKLDAYLKKLFGNARVRVVPRPKKDDSAEVYVGDEFIGVLFVDDEDDERSYNFQMAILGSDWNERTEDGRQTSDSRALGSDPPVVSLLSSVLRLRMRCARAGRSRRQGRANPPATRAESAA